MPTKRILRRALTATCWLAIAGAAATGTGRHQDGGTDVGIWSRYPLAETRQLTGFAFAPVQAGIVVGGQRLTVIGFHSKALGSTARRRCPALSSDCGSPTSPGSRR